MFLMGLFKTASAGVKALASGDTSKNETITDVTGDADTRAIDASRDASEEDAHHLHTASAEEDTLQPQVAGTPTDPRDEDTTDLMDDPLGGTLFETLRLDSHPLAREGGDAPTGDDPVVGHLGADRLIDAEAEISAPVPDWTDAAHLVFGSDAVAVPLPGAGGDADLGAYIGNAIVPTITDFDPALDELQLVYDASTVDDPTVTTRMEGDVLTLELCGAVVARLEGIRSIDPALIRLIPISA